MGGGGEFSEIGGGFVCVNKGGVIGGIDGVLWIAESATPKDLVDLEGVKGSPGVRWGVGVPCTELWHVVQVHIGNVGWGD